MFGKRCSLCGGKLDGRNVCKECGLNNSKSDINYRLNQGSCEQEPLTHVHSHSNEREGQRQTGRQVPQRQPAKRQQNGQSFTRQPVRQQRDQNFSQQPVRRQKKKHSRRWLVFIPIILIFFAIVASIGSAIFNVTEQVSIENMFENGEDFDYDPYEYVERELSAEGEHCELILGPGEYVGGVHIPEGAYKIGISGSGESADVQVDDEINGIYLYEGMYADEPEIEDIRIYSGAKVEVSGNAKVLFTTENGQVQEQVSYENPLTETVHFGDELLEDGAEAGINFEPGVYDIYVEEGYGSVEVVIYDGLLNVIDDRYIWLDAESEEENCYRNVVLPQGAMVWPEEGMKIYLQPSEQIATEDYKMYYSQEEE